jgi:hypothetical protein
LRASGSRECAPDDRLREIVIVSFARFWNDTFSCLPECSDAIKSGVIGVLA